MALNLIPGTRSQATPEFSRECVKLLADALNQHHKLRKVNHSAWVSHFDKLSKTQTPERIQQVLQWYCDHIGGEFIPEAYSAKSFREKFKAIEHQMADDPMCVVVNDVCKELADRLLQEGQWPCNVRDVLPALVQQSWDEYTLFYIRLKKRKEFLAVQYPPENGDDRVKWHRGQATLSLLNHLFAVHFFSDPYWFVKAWMVRIKFDLSWRTILGRWLVFDPKSIIFHKMGQEATFAYCGEYSRWKMLIEEVNCE